MTETTPVSGSTAVVIGAGIAGLCAARVLADRYAHVVVLDRDHLPPQAVPRRGVPQGHHGAVLLAAGQQALGELFPGLVDELVGAGAVPFEPGTEMTFYRYGSVWPKAPTGISVVSFSRPLLEHALRGRVAARANVRIRAEVAAAALAGTGGMVTGVVLDSGETIPCAVVVDCSGRGSRSDRWLAELGFAAPAVTEVKIGVGYATRLFRRGPGDLADGTALLVLPDAPYETRAGMALPIEGDRWLVSMGGWHGDFPAPGDQEAFAAHARSLPHPGIAELMDRCDPVTGVVSFTFPSSRRRHFEDLPAHPAGYLALGDAMCSFNPIYGQGMTCAALQARALGRQLDAHGAATAALAADYYREASGIIATPWQFAAGGDFAYPQTQGVRPRGIALRNHYSRRLQLAAQVDPDIRRVFTAVQHLLTPPGVLRRPAMVLRVLRLSRRAPGARPARR
jgi:2-polyprenyl-6-methoxyphenol hydroxylase-like FAD-dependent oxidoreductase